MAKATEPAAVQWLTTSPNPAAQRGTPFWDEYDQGQRGWRLHAVEAAESETLSQVAGRRAACGLRPAHGWDLDMFIEDRCARCVARLSLPETVAERERRVTREAARTRAR